MKGGAGMSAPLTLTGFENLSGLGEVLEIGLLLLFCLLLFLIFLYSLSQLHLLISYLRKRKDSTKDLTGFENLLSLDHYPLVTIQLPLYNEKEVVERLLNNIARIDYPKEKLEIQVLDDSTDESAFITRKLVSHLQESGLQIHYLSRTNRKDFKAGALKEGLKTAKGEFIAIFDSDFLPRPDWLKRTLPYFQDERIGVVQTRWGHLNRNFSLLTKIQAFALDFHFILEQNGRNYSKNFINFNGTAGIWRKQCILEAGNWQGDTLTEDLDLSYRAQLKGWRFKYLEAIETSAELPITLEAVRSQQFRWNKGAAENFRKNFKKIMSAKGLSLETRIHSFFHLLNSSLFLLILGLSLLSLPILLLTGREEYSVFFDLMLFFGISSLIFFISYWVTYSRIHGKGFKDFLSFIGMFLSFFSIAMGFSLHNSRAVLEGHLGMKSKFVRTPKFNVLGRNFSHQNLRKGEPGKIRFQLILEILLLIYFSLAIILAFWLNKYSMLLFHLMLVSGYGFVVFHSLFGSYTTKKVPQLKVSKNHP